jgi:hypothetical protein
MAADVGSGGETFALGMTTHSHVCGLVHDTVTAYEIVTADGELVRATADNEHADLFRALPWSHGTLGLLVALEMRVIPAPSHVRLVYRPFYALDTYAEEYRRLVTDEDPPHFVETLIFGKDRAVILEGHLATQDEVRAGKLPVNAVSRYYKPLFYKHVEGMLELGEGRRHEELVPMYDYLMRHDRSMCMCLAQILPTANEPWFRYTMGWMLPPNTTFLKGTRPEAERENTIRKQVWQEYAFPAEHFAEMVRHVSDHLRESEARDGPASVPRRGAVLGGQGRMLRPHPGTAAPTPLEVVGFVVGIEVFGRQAGAQIQNRVVVRFIDATSVIPRGLLERHQRLLSDQISQTAAVVVWHEHLIAFVDVFRRINVVVVVKDDVRGLAHAPGERPEVSVLALSDLHRVSGARQVRFDLPDRLA